MQQVAEKWPCLPQAGICSVVLIPRRLRAEALRRASVVAAYRKVRLTPQDFEGSR